jgi:hypothetical protein
MCEGDFTPIPADRNEDHDVMFVEVVAVPSAPMLPDDGQITDPPVQPCVKKYFDSLLTQITHISLAIPAHTEGRFAIVTDVGCGMRWTRHVKGRMTLRADGEVVWS